MDQPTSNSPLQLIVGPTMSHRRVLYISLVGFGFLVGLVLLAGYLGYSGSDRIQDAAQALTREHGLQSTGARRWKVRSSKKHNY